MAKYGERISGRPCYQSYRQKECNWSGVGGVGSVGGVGGRLATTSGYPKTLAEEVQWRQRRFAWWGSHATPPTPQQRPLDVSCRPLAFAFLEAIFLKRDLSGSFRIFQDFYRFLKNFLTGIFQHFSGFSPCFKGFF